VALLSSCVIQTHKQQHGFISSFIFYYLGKKTVPLQIEFVYAPQQIGEIAMLAI
jgi:hypothetical protein